MGSMSEPLRVLFVCTANICRSAYAERRARFLHETITGGAEAVEFHSAGVHGFDHKHMDRPMAVELQQRGGDPHGFRSRPLSASDITSADLIVTAETAHRTFILDDFPQVVSRLFTMGQLSQSLTRVDPALRGRDLLQALRSQRGPAGVELDVVDPYRKGQEAAAACADAIDGHLHDLVPRLVDGAGGAAGSAG